MGMVNITMKVENTTIGTLQEVKDKLASFTSSNPTFVVMSFSYAD